MIKFNIINFYIIVCLLFKIVYGQVNTEIQQLQDEFFNFAQGSDYKMKWFKLEKMSNFARFMLCVDVYQKINKIRLMDGQYDGELPKFERSSLRVRHSSYPDRTESVLKRVLSCPLNKIKFEKLHDYGIDFYVTESIKEEYCVYVLRPLVSFHHDDPILKIISEVCGILVDIRYNRTELEVEYLKTPSKSRSNTRYWKELYLADGPSRYTLCLSVYEKINRAEIYNDPFAKTLLVNQSEIEIIIGNLYLLLKNESEPQDFATVLLCPKIMFNHYQNDDPEPYRLSHSVNEGCVYILRPIVSWTGLQINDRQLMHDLYIQAELCGIYGPLKAHTVQLQKDFLKKWDALLSQNKSIPWLELGKMDFNHRIQLCTNVYKKFYERPLSMVSVTTRSIYTNVDIDAQLYIHSDDRNVFAKTAVLTCEMNDIVSVPERTVILLTESVNIGCVYKLGTQHAHDESENHILIIHLEVCGVYPIRHLLNIVQSKKCKPILQ